MCGPYWSQWDREDLDSWQGKDCEEDEDLCEEELIVEMEKNCSCSNCMYCLGMSWRDFL